MDTVSRLVESHTHTNGSLPIWPVATRFLSAWRAKLEKKKISHNFRVCRGGATKYKYELIKWNHPRSLQYLEKIISDTCFSDGRISPDNVIRVAQIEPLLALGNIVDHTHSSNKVDHLARGGVVEVVATLVSTVTVHPLQTELALGGCLVSHDTRYSAASWNLTLLGKLILTTLTEITTYGKRTASICVRLGQKSISVGVAGTRCAIATPPPTWTACACAINHYVSQRHEDSIKNGHAHICDPTFACWRC